MDNIFRVCIMGRYYDIPTQEVSDSTLDALKAIADSSNNINPRDLLKAFLESCEIKAVLKETIEQANIKLDSTKNS